MSKSAVDKADRCRRDTVVSNGMGMVTEGRGGDPGAFSFALRPSFARRERERNRAKRILCPDYPH